MTAKKTFILQHLLQSSLAKRYSILAIITLLYYTTGKLGLLMAIPFTNVTPIWPPSGIGIAATLLFGYQVWPAIFIGSFIANLDALLSSPSTPSLLTASCAGILIGAGTLLQTTIGTFLINRYCRTTNPIANAQGTFFFLLISMFCCLINSTTGVITLTSLHFIQWSSFTKIWWTWWLGDVTGIFVTTPLILSWIFPPRPPKEIKKIGEGLLLLLALVTMAFLLFDTRYHSEYMLLPFLIFPFLLWAAFRFGLKGAALAIGILSFISIWGTARGHGPFVHTNLNTSLLLLQSFIAITTVTMLSLASVLKERKDAQRLLNEYSRTLEIKVASRTEELQHKNKTLEETLVELKTMQNQLISHEKLASLGIFMIGIAHELNESLNLVNNFAELAQELSTTTQNAIVAQKEQIEASQFEAIDNDLKLLQVDIAAIMKYGKRMENIVKILQQHSQEKSGEFQETNINSVVKEAVQVAAQEACAKEGLNDCKIEEKYEKTIEMVQIIPRDINRALLYILHNAIYELLTKKKQLGAAFHPLITVHTRQIEQGIAISIRDNGNGIPEDIRNKLFIPFFTTKPPGEGVGLGLSISHDIIVSGHAGQIQVETKPGEFTEFTIILPKQIQQLA